MNPSGPEAYMCVEAFERLSINCVIRQLTPLLDVSGAMNDMERLRAVVKLCRPKHGELVRKKLSSDFPHGFVGIYPKPDCDPNEFRETCKNQILQCLLGYLPSSTSNVHELARHLAQARKDRFVALLHNDRKDWLECSDTKSLALNLRQVASDLYRDWQISIYFVALVCNNLSDDFVEGIGVGARSPTVIEGCYPKKCLRNILELSKKFINLVKNKAILLPVILVSILFLYWFYVQSSCYVELLPNKKQVCNSETISITVNVKNCGTPVHYEWSSEKGKVPSGRIPNSTIDYVAPHESGTDVIEVIVFDPICKRGSRKINMPVLDCVKP